jgi:ABC-type bacteriocin/lantibiotic exporter with double-glycine peptidase domain
VLLAIAWAGCASYAGGAKSIDPARLGEPQWIVAGPMRVIRQRGPLDCGAAALAMVAQRWEVMMTAEDPAFPTPSANGLRLGDLRTVARGHGLIAFAIAADRATLLHELRAGRPVIVGLLRPYTQRKAVSHYEVVVAERGDEIVTIDPAAGWRVRSWAAFDAEWRPAAYPALVVLGPGKR